MWPTRERTDDQNSREIGGTTAIESRRIFEVVGERSSNRNAGGLSNSALKWGGQLPVPPGNSEHRNDRT